MAVIFLVPRLCVFILMSLSLLLGIVLLSQFIAGIYNAMKTYYQKTMRNHRHIFNLYLFHHLIICIIRCIITFLICFYLVIYNECLSLEFAIDFLLLLSTFNLFLIIIGETAHFWDSTINHRSTIYSKYCLIFGLIFNYFLSILFLSVYIIIGGGHPLMIDLCKIIKQKLNFDSNYENEKSSLPIRIIYILFILFDLLTCLWIYITYKDIAKLKRKRLATVFFQSLVFTNFKENERTKMVNQSLKRILSICLFLLSNIIVILPVLTMKVFHINFNIYFRIIFIYLTILPWCESITFLFFHELKFRLIRQNFPTKKDHHSQELIGRRLSSYRESMTNI
jgi:hypothetical protein